MTAVAGSLYLVSTVAFCAVCLVIGTRLLLLSRRTGGRPERLLGAGLGLTGGVGYGGLIAVALLREAQGGDPTPLFSWASALFKAAHDLGVVFVLGFLLTVFRPDSRGARVLAGAMAAVLWAGFLGYALGGGFAHGRAEGFWYWAEFSVISTYTIWGAIEAFRYWAAMRRRVAMGLADPLVANRFLLWGLGSTLATAAIWTISIPALRGVNPTEGLQPTYMLVTALWGTGSIAAYWLTFFPPRWYRDRVAANAG